MDGTITARAASEGYAPELLDLEGAINATPESACKVAERLKEDLTRNYQDIFNEAWSTPPEFRRRKYARLAGHIVASRWGDAPSASRATLIIFLMDGPKAAVEFMEDLQRQNI